MPPSNTREARISASVICDKSATVISFLCVIASLNNRLACPIWRYPKHEFAILWCAIGHTEFIGDIPNEINNVVALYFLGYLAVV